MLLWLVLSASLAFACPLAYNHRALYAQGDNTSYIGATDVYYYTPWTPVVLVGSRHAFTLMAGNQSLAQLVNEEATWTLNASDALVFAQHADGQIRLVGTLLYLHMVPPKNTRIQWLALLPGRGSRFTRCIAAYHRSTKQHKNHGTSMLQDGAQG